MELKEIISKRVKAAGAIRNLYKKLPESTRMSLEDYLEESFNRKEDEFIAMIEAKIPATLEMSKFREACTRPLLFSDTDKIELLRSGLISPELIALIGPITAADYFYDLSKLNPNIINALDFSRKNTDFQTFEDVRKFVSENKSNLLSHGNIIRDRGYSAEQIVAEKYREKGHIVEFPNDPRQEGYDLIIDGVPFQVKCGGPDNITDHFEKYPDIPVIANREVADSFINDDRVHVEPDLSSEDLTNLQQSIIEQFDDMGKGTDIGIPVLLMVSCIYKAFRKYSASELTTKEAIKYVAFDGGAAIAGALAGKKLGFFFGALLSGPTGGISLVIGPMVGGILGLILGEALARYFRGREIRAAYNHLVSNAKILKSRIQELGLLVLDNSRIIRNQLASAMRDSRWQSRRILAIAAAKDAFSHCMGNPTYNYALFSLIAQRHRQEALDIWSAKKYLKEKLLAHSKVTDENINELSGIILQYRAAIEYAIPQSKSNFEKTIKMFSICTQSKNDYDRLSKALA